MSPKFLGPPFQREEIDFTVMVQWEKIQTEGEETDSELKEFKLSCISSLFHNLIPVQSWPVLADSLGLGKGKRRLFLTC